MMKQLENLKKDFNVFNMFMDESVSIKLLKIYGYESRVGGVLYRNEKRFMEMNPEEKQLLGVLRDLIEKRVIEIGLIDNKIVAEIYVGPFHLFVGYWDWYFTIGTEVIPGNYSRIREVSEDNGTVR